MGRTGHLERFFDAINTSTIAGEIDGKKVSLYEAFNSFGHINGIKLNAR